MRAPPTPAAEVQRLEELRSYGILDTETEAAFDDLVQLAALTCGTPIAAISLVDETRQWFKASVGLPVRETPREVAFCAHTILDDEVMMVADASADLRFVDNPLVTDGVQIRFYAGAPLRTPQGMNLGSLCVIDRCPRVLTAEQVLTLQCLSRQVVQLFELRLTNKRMKAALEELAASRAHHQAVTNSALDAIVAADQTGSITNWNAGAQRIFGYSSSEIVGRPLSVLVPEEYRAAHERGLVRVAATGKSEMAGRTVQLQGLRKDGSTFNVEMSVGSWTTPHGPHFSGVLRDISAQKLAAQVIKNERDFTAAILDASDALIIVLSPEGTITRFNRACEAASGYKAIEVIGRSFDLLLPKPEAEGVLDAFRRLKLEQLQSRYENNWQAKDGRLRLISWSNTTLLDSEGALTHVIGTGIDVTEKRSAEVALSQQSAIMASVLEHMSDGVIVTDKAGQFLVYNAAAEEMLGRGPNDGTPDTWPAEFGLFTADGEARLPLAETPLARALQGEHVEQFEIFMRAPLFPQGRYHSVTSSPMYDAQRSLTGTISVARDITERKRAVDALRRERDFSAALLAAMRDGYLLTSGGIIIEVNDEVCRLTEFRRDELLGASAPYPFWAAEDTPENTVLRARAHEAGGADFEVKLCKKNGEKFDALVAVRPASLGGDSVGYVTTVRDITQQKIDERALVARATIDALTGLLNRGAFDERLREEFERWRRHSRPMTLALVDVDHFKSVNDTHGHPQGDAVLRELAARMTSQSRAGDVFGRVGGEEIAWIMADADPSQALIAAERVRATIEAKPFERVGRVTISIGLTSFSEGLSHVDIYGNADGALYAAKRQGRNRVAATGQKFDAPLAEQASALLGRRP